MIIIGLTGGIASGKSTVAKMLAQKGAYLLDADQLAREAVEPDQPAWREIVDWLGPGILLSDRSIDRVKLGNLVFNNSNMLERLNKIVHPWVGSKFLDRAGQIKNLDPDGVLIYDIPLLIEAGLAETVDLVLLVYLPRNVQLARLRERDHISAEAAEKRVRAQIPLEEKKKYAAAVIDNSGTLAETADQVDKFWEELQQGGYQCTK